MGYNKIVQSSSGFRERAHTADWELEVWAPDLPSLFEQAARGMYALAGVRLMPEPIPERSFKLTAMDGESLLVRFLEELLYLLSMESLAFDGFDLRLAGWRLEARLTGARVASLDKEIKAVTYHNLVIQVGSHGLEVRIVFDV